MPGPYCMTFLYLLCPFLIPPSYSACRALVAVIAGILVGTYRRIILAIAAIAIPAYGGYGATGFGTGSASVAGGKCENDKGCYGDDGSCLFHVIVFRKN